MKSDLTTNSLSLFVKENNKFVDKPLNKIVTLIQKETTPTQVLVEKIDDET